MKKKLLKIFIPLACVLIIVAITLTYLCTYYKAVDVNDYFVSNDEVKITENKKYYVFDGNGTEDAFIFYPGAKVDEKAYSPILYQLAKAGIDCYLMKMPFHMAIFDVKEADIIFNDTLYSNYYIGGHSMGGAMAASYCSSTSNDIKGLILFAAYSAKDLKDKEDLKVLSLYGSNDGVLSLEKVVSSREYMPSSYEEVVIDGGNHAQFGSYGKQKKDNEATITKEEQFDITVSNILEFIK